MKDSLPASNARPYGILAMRGVFSTACCGKVEGNAYINYGGVAWIEFKSGNKAYVSTGAGFGDMPSMDRVIRAGHDKVHLEALLTGQEQTLSMQYSARPNDRLRKSHQGIQAEFASAASISPEPG
jgi:hypothetical protein